MSVSRCFAARTHNSFVGKIGNDAQAEWRKPTDAEPKRCSYWNVFLTKQRALRSTDASPKLRPYTLMTIADKSIRAHQRDRIGATKGAGFRYFVPVEKT